MAEEGRTPRRDAPIESTVGVGLDVGSPDETSEAERAAHRASFEELIGYRHLGLNYLLDHRPDALKRYRAWADRIDVRPAPPEGGAEVAWSTSAYNPHGFGLLVTYALTGFRAGVRYAVNFQQRYGCSRSMVLEGLAVAFIWAGPRGMETIAEALDGYRWAEPADPPAWPAEWTYDRTQLQSGIDFSTPELSADELRRLVDWYERVEGEVPAYVTRLGADRPELLKGYRARFEQTLRELPNQVLPYVMAQVNVERGFRPGIREGVLLARGLGMTRDQTIEALSWGLFYGGAEAASGVEAAAGDVLDAW